MSCNKGIFRVSRRDLEDVARGKLQKLGSASWGIADGMRSAGCSGGTGTTAWRKETALEECRRFALAFMAEPDMAGERYEYAVLMTGCPLDVLTLAQLYRDRGDTENPFDEPKNQ